MPLIDAATVAYFQRLSEDTMPDEVTIEDTYGEPVADAGGGLVYDQSAVAITKGRIMPLDSLSLESERAGQLAQDGVEVLRVPLDAPVTNTSVITVDSARLGTITRYTVEEVVPLGTFSPHRKVLVKPAPKPDE